MEYSLRCSSREPPSIDDLRHLFGDQANARPTRGAQHDDSDTARAEIVLILQIVCCGKHGEASAFCGQEQFAVLQRGSPQRS